MASWDDVPHLTEDAKTGMLAAYPPHMRDARSRGLPMLGSGAIYPVSETEVTVADFSIPPHWKKCYGLDVGWNFTAACWIAQDPDTGIAYVYSSYKREKSEPSIHATAIKARGEWVPGAIDPASAGAGQIDGRRMIDLYNNLGLKLTFADNSVEAGLFKCWEMLSTGQLKVFASCQQWFAEYRNYCRDEKGRIVKVDDHVMDAFRYAVMTGLGLAKTLPPPVKKGPSREYVRAQGGWMG